jgi:hypothetical protein
MEKMKVKRSDSDLSDYCLDRLFDPEQLYYTPMEQLIKQYKTRDLLYFLIYLYAFDLIKIIYSKISHCDMIFQIKIYTNKK